MEELDLEINGENLYDMFRDSFQNALYIMVMT